MSAQDLCFEQKLENYHNFSSEYYPFNSREILQYITWACLRNDKTEHYWLPTHARYINRNESPCHKTRKRLNGFRCMKSICIQTADLIIK